MPVKLLWMIRLSRSEWACIARAAKPVSFLSLCSTVFAWHPGRNLLPFLLASFSADLTQKQFSPESQKHQSWCRRGWAGTASSEKPICCVDPIACVTMCHGQGKKKKKPSQIVLLKFIFKLYFLSLACIACFSACFSAGMASCCAFWVVSGNSDVDSLL